MHSQQQAVSAFIPLSILSQLIFASGGQVDVSLVKDPFTSMEAQML